MATYSIKLLVLGWLFVAAQSANIFHFSIDRAPKEKSVEVFNEEVNEKTRHGFFSPQETMKAKRGNGFNWKNCGDPRKELLVIDSLSISPDPVKIPGNIILSMKATLNKTVDAPLKVDVTLKKKMFDIWIEVPCVDNVGSCSYADVCGKLPPSCPLPFVQQKVPCKCPFPKGSYNLTNAEFSLQLPSGPLETGDFQVAANLSTNGIFVGCYIIELSLTN